MRLKRGAARKGNDAEQPFRSFQVELSTLERAARHGKDPAARSKAADRLIIQARDLEAQVQSMLALPETRDRFNTARFALGMVVSAEDPAIRKKAFESLNWNVLALRNFQKNNPYGDIRRLARERLDSARTRRSELIKEEEDPRPAGTNNYVLGTWRTA